MHLFKKKKKPWSSDTSILSGQYVSSPSLGFLFSNYILKEIYQISLKIAILVEFILIYKIFTKAHKTHLHLFKIIIMFLINIVYSKNFFILML
jgi:hypothetical protein